jgi:DNA-directed RNA polymerase specialized sigma24 family protein
VVVVKKIRASRDNARVEMENGMLVKVPAELAVIGTEIPEKDVARVCKGGSYLEDLVHVSLVKERAKPKKLPVRKLDVNYVQVRNFVLKYLSTHFRAKFNLSFDDVEDICQEILVKWTQHGYLEGFDPSLGVSWEAFLAHGVRTKAQDFLKNSRNQHARSTLSLQNKAFSTSEGEAPEMLDLVQAERYASSLDQLIVGDIAEAFQKAMVDWDIKYPNHNPQHPPFLVIYQHLVENDLKGLHESKKWSFSESWLRVRINDIRRFLGEYYERDFSSEVVSLKKLSPEGILEAVSEKGGPVEEAIAV